MAPQTRYARSGDVSIAYQVTGEGPFDLVLSLPWGCHVELAWEVPSIRAMFERFGSFARLIHFDKRGVGLSDRSVGIPSPETRMDDIRAVMDAAGSKRAAIMGWSEGVQLGLLFAATYPDRAWALVAYGGSPDGIRTSDEVLSGAAEERARRERDPVGFALEESRSAMPTGSEEEIAALARMFRYALAPGDEFAYVRMNLQIRLDRILSAIAIPTLVLHNIDDGWVSRERARGLAALIPGARYVEVPVVGHVPCLAEAGPPIDAIDSFLSEAWAADAAGREPERVLATVLFTDIVGSTERAAELGDRGWRELLEQHHAIVRNELARTRGREVDTAGDGFFAAFDGPARAIRCARNITDTTSSELGLRVRAGLHTGECELLDGKIGGIAVHTGARIASLAGPGEVLVSQTVTDLVAGSTLEFEDRGVHELKGIPGEWRLYAAL